jgi:hypothetical protein
LFLSRSGTQLTSVVPRDLVSESFNAVARITCLKSNSFDGVERIRSSEILAPSVAKRVQSGGFYFHAKDDPPEVRERLFKWIRETNCSLEMVVGRKIPALFARKHNGKDSEFYADLLSHLLKNKLKLGQRLVINIAERGKTARNLVLELAMIKARERFAKKQDASAISSEVVFNVQTPRTEPLLCVPRGEKTAMVETAILRQLGDFSVSGLQNACPSVGVDLIRQVLKRQKEAGQLICLGRGPAAKWRKTAK